MYRLLVLFLIINTTAFSQRLIEGKVVDFETGKPVPFASIGLVGTSKGTSTNINGEFSISIDALTDMKISCIGYESMVINATKDNLQIRLKPVAIQLNAIVILDRSINARKVLRKTFANRGRNYSKQDFLQRFFYRHYCKDNNTYGRLIEAYVDVWKERGYRLFRNEAGLDEEIQVTQLRRSLDKTELAQGHEPISIGNILQADLVGYQTKETSEHLSFFTDVNNLRTDFEDYSFTSEGMTYYDGIEVYKITYAYKKDSVLTTDGKYLNLVDITGSLYITTDTYAFIKTEEKKVYANYTLHTTTYYRKYGTQYYPYHLVRDGESHYTNSEEHDFHIELMSVEIQEGATKTFAGKLPGKKELMQIPYDSNFWSTNTILKTTPLEDEIIRDLGDGISLNKQFYRYHQYEMNLHNGGEEAEEKLNWILKESKGNKLVYLVFWSPQFQPYLADLEYAKRLNKQFQNHVSFIFVSTDDNEDNWKETVSRFNFSTDGLVNYRIGSHSSIAKKFQLKSTPHFILLDYHGEGSSTDTKRPSDPLLVDDLNGLIQQH